MFRKQAGLPEIVEGFDEQLQELWDDQQTLIQQEKDRVEERPKLPELDSFDTWPEWEEHLLTALGTMRNQKTEFPLSCLLRPERNIPSSISVFQLSTRSFFAFSVSNFKWNVFPKR